MKYDTTETRRLLGAGVFYQPLVSLYRKLDSFNASILHNICTNGIFTNTDLVDLGYNIDPVCKACNNSLDTVFHRCFTCPAIEVRAKIALGDDHFNRIISEGETLYSTRCLAPAPFMSQTPSKELVFSTITFVEGDRFLPEGGRVYGDGSCFFPTAKPLSRAGFAVVQVNPDGSLLKGLFGAIPAGMPQTSLAGEYGALSCAYDNSMGVDFVGDCLDVINNFNGGVKGP